MDVDLLRKELVRDEGLRLRPYRDSVGKLSIGIGRNLDDPTLWVLTTQWENVGAYRRALSSYDVKLHAVPLLSRAIDEPSAYEVVEPGAELNVGGSRGDGTA
jgi:hypothetical protein